MAAKMSSTRPVVKTTTKKVTTLKEITVKPKPEQLAKKETKKPITKDTYRYFMGSTDTSKPTKEVTRSTYEKGGAPRIKIAASDTASINNLTRSRGNFSSKGFIALKKK